jgi:hypothetical protein
MHFDMLPKDTRNEEAIREYEQAENRRIRRWAIRLLLLLPLLGGLVWVLFHVR